jgi:hypothetical protein
MIGLGFEQTVRGAMPISSRVWAWLGKPRNRSVLAFLGAGVAAIGGAAWQLYLHLAPPAAAPPTPVVIQMPAAQAQALPGAGPSPDVNAVKTLQASQTRTLNAEASALDNIAQQIEASNAPHRPAAQGR